MGLSEGRVKELEELSGKLRKELIEILYGIQTGHPGGSLSATEIITTLYQEKIWVETEKAVFAAALLLSEQGISARVVDIHTIKPLDETLILECAEKCGCILTVEEHSVYGGLGSAVCEVVSSQSPALVDRMGLSDFSESGAYEELLMKAQLDSRSILLRADRLVQRK